MTVTAQGYAQSRQILWDQNARPVIGGYLYVNAAGTTSLVTSYADASLTTPNPNPLRTDGFGRIPPIYFGTRVDSNDDPIDGGFKVVAQDASGAQLWVDDGLPPGVDYDAKAAAAAQAAGAGVSGAVTGDLKDKHGSTTDAGWLWANGQTIGSAGSPATARASADTKALFVYLWNNDPSLAVSGNRGVSASSDFIAGKTIALPMYQGKVRVACDKMGAPATAGIITNATTPNPDQIGTSFGVEAQTLTAGQLPVITPTITLDAGVARPGIHKHVAATTGAGGHTHDVNETAHSHGTAINTQNGNVGTQSGAVQALNYAPDQKQGTTGVKTGLTIVAVGDHTHGVSIDNGDANGGGDHTHTAQSSSFGGGGSHPNVQPSILVYTHIKL